MRQRYLFPEMGPEPFTVEALLKLAADVKGDFKPYISIHEKANAINAYFKPDADYSERINEEITLFRSIETNEITGCRLKGIFKE